MVDLASLNSRFAIPGVATVGAGHGGLPVVQISKPGVCTGSVYLHGAHVTAWRPEGAEEVLWLSEKSAWQGDKPIRGGVPVCFPWFGPRNSKDYPDSPMHGFARFKAWDLESVTDSPAGVTVVLRLQNDAATMALWPVPFTLRHRITFGRELQMALEFANKSDAAVTFEEAQHTYFSVGDVRQVRISGLEGRRYIDKTDGFQEKQQAGDVTITAETDRVYLSTPDPITITDPVKRRRILIHKENSLATVIWNPWIAKAKAMADFGDEEWPGMLCAETASAGPHAVRAAPGQMQVMATRVAVAGM